MTCWKKLGFNTKDKSVAGLQWPSRRVDTAGHSERWGERLWYLHCLYCQWDWSSCKPCSWIALKTSRTVEIMQQNDWKYLGGKYCLWAWKNNPAFKLHFAYLYVVSILIAVFDNSQITVCKTVLLYTFWGKKKLLLFLIHYQEWIHTTAPKPHKPAPLKARLSSRGGKSWSTTWK